VKILQVIPYLNPKRGGDVNVCYNLSINLAKRGHRVTILTTDFELDTEFVDKLRQCGTEVISFHCVSTTGLFLFSPSMGKWLARNSASYDVIHLHDYRSYQNAVVGRCVRKNRTPLVLQAHGSLPRIYSKRPLKALYDLVWGRGLLKHSTMLLALTDAESSMYQERGVPQQKVRILPTGIDLTDYTTLPPRGELRRKIDLDPDDKLILYLGRIHKSKGLDILLEAFKCIDGSLDAYLVLIGPDAGYRKSLEKSIFKLEISKRVIFRDFVSEGDKKEAYVDADVFVTPRYHGSPSTLLEAAACRAPIVTTQAGDAMSWIDGGAGVVTEFDARELQKAITHILTDSNFGRTLGEKGREIVLSNFTWVKITDMLERYYVEAIRESRAN
jgi:glycosyltransferase involved in cell wall biosynthesis